MKKPDSDITNAIYITDTLINVIDMVHQGNTSVQTLEYARDWIREEALFYRGFVKAKILDSLADWLDLEINRFGG